MKLSRFPLFEKKLKFFSVVHGEKKRGSFRKFLFVQYFLNVISKCNPSFMLLNVDEEKFVLQLRLMSLLDARLNILKFLLVFQKTLPPCDILSVSSAHPIIFTIQYKPEELEFYPFEAQLRISNIRLRLTICIVYVPFSIY